MSKEQKVNSPRALKREVGFWGAVGMGLGSIVGTGVFVSLAIAAGVTGSWVLVAVGIAALVATANGLSSAQLAAAHPVSGGTYEYGYRFVSPGAGFSAGVLYLAAKSASAATAALGCVGYALHLLDLDVVHSVYVAISVALVALVTVLVASGVRRSNWANGVIVFVTLSTLLSFVVLGIPEVDWSNLVPRRFESAGDVQSLLAASALMFVAYTGYGRIATLGEEVKDPARTIPKAVIVTLLVSMALYLSVCAVAVGAVGSEVFAETASGTAAPLEVVARTFGHPIAGPLVSAGAITAMLGVLLNLVLGLSRVVLAMSRRSDLPPLFAKVDAKGSPRRAVLLMGVVVALIVLVGDIRVTWSFSALTVLVYYGLTNLSALRLDEAQRRFPRWIAMVGLASCFGLAFFVDAAVWPVAIGGLAGAWLLRAMFRRHSR